MEIIGTLVMASDTVLLPVGELSNELRRQINAENGDFAVTRPNSRTTTRIVDADAAKLLQEFRQPSTIVQAVIRYCSVNQKNPEQILDAAFPMLQRLVHERLLVPSDSPHAQSIRPLLENGDIFADAEVLSCLQNLEDTDVYRVRTSQGAAAALKVMRSTADSTVAARFEREASVLKHLDGAITPSLLGSNTKDEPRYLLLSWCEGNDGASFAASLREDGDLAALLRLCVGVLKAYAHLHDQKVIHSDVHAGNILVDDDYTVRLIDFGLARIAEVEEAPQPGLRGGVGYFMEPEYAHSQRLGHRPPPSSMLGEQYSLAALLYFFFTGSHYIDFSLERQEMERQIVENDPLPFSTYGLMPWPAVEDVLRKALSKKPAERFPSIHAFLAALSATAEPPVSDVSAKLHPATQATVKQTLTRVLTRLDIGSELLRSDVSSAPPASLTHGSTGVACALHRIACARRDPRLLALADLWCERAVRDFPLQDAQYSPAIEVTTEPVGSISPYHMESGVHLIRALIANSRGDVATQQQAMDEFIANSIAPCDHLDLTLGRSGTLLAASHLLAALSNSGSVDIEPLRQLGNATLASIWRQLDAYPAMLGCSQVRLSGMAHGWAGILYATLCWSRASGIGLPPNTDDRLNQLAALAHHSGRQTSWNPHVGEAHDPSNPLIASWCNGTAGQVQLWLAAYATLKDERYLSLADRCGRHAAEVENGIGNLCCGLAGQAYALLALYRSTGEIWWRHRAQRLAERAAKAYRDVSSESATHAQVPYPNSLFKGEVGLAVLAADLENPVGSAFPAVEVIEFQAV